MSIFNYEHLIEKTKTRNNEQWQLMFFSFGNIKIKKGNRSSAMQPGFKDLVYSEFVIDAIQISERSSRNRRTELCIFE